jgi:hypothetical protein
MDIEKKEKFLELWPRYFGDSPLPVCFYYTDIINTAETAQQEIPKRCVIQAVYDVTGGMDLRLDVGSVPCAGGKKYLGFTKVVRPDFEYFLSCGIPGKVKGELYKKAPELVRQAVALEPELTAPGNFTVFKRWDKLEQSDEPEVVIFFVSPDVIAALFTLANFDRAEPNGVFCPFGSGCSTVIRYPYLEMASTHPRAVLGLFDISARPYVPPDILSFSVPFKRFSEMIENIEDSFLITESWSKIKIRVG